MTKSIDSIKIEIIQLVSSIDDVKLLSRIASSIRLPNSAKKSIFDLGSVEFKPVPSFEELYISQGRKSIVFEDLPSSNEDWGYSLDEVLAAL